MNEVMDRLTYEAKTAKKVYLYKNGSRYVRPKCMVINDRQIRDFSSFLNRVTSGIRAPVAVRNIYTPAQGHKVHSLDELRSGCYYVAGGSEHFKKIPYGTELPKIHPRKKTEFDVPHRTQPFIIARARYKLPVDKPFVIHVFRNGDEKYRGVRVLLPRKIMGSWEHVLELITVKAQMVTPAKRIYTLDGRAIHAVSEIQDGGKYVALEGSRPFQKVAYCAIDDKKLTSLRTIPRIAVRMRHKSEHLSGPEAENSYKAGHLLPPLHKGPRERKKSIRPMAGRKNKEGREKAIKDHREDSIFGGSPRDFELDDSTRVAKMPSPPLKRPNHHIPPELELDKEKTSSNMQSSQEAPLSQSTNHPNMDTSLEDPFTSSPPHVDVEPLPTSPIDVKSLSPEDQLPDPLDRKGEFPSKELSPTTVSTPSPEHPHPEVESSEEPTGTPPTSVETVDKSVPQDPDLHSTTHPETDDTTLSDSNTHPGMEGTETKSPSPIEDQTDIAIRPAHSGTLDGNGNVHSKSDSYTGSSDSDKKASIFHADTSVSVTQSSEEYVEVNQGDLFKAKEQRVETAGAEMIQEGKETEVEKPIDQEEAVEVEEMVPPEGDVSGEIQQSDHEDTESSEPQPDNTSAVLSSNRKQSPTTTSTNQADNLTKQTSNTKQEPDTIEEVMMVEEEDKEERSGPTSPTDTDTTGNEVPDQT